MTMASTASLTSRGFQFTVTTVTTFRTYIMPHGLQWFTTRKYRKEMDGWFLKTRGGVGMTNLVPKTATRKQRMRSARPHHCHFPPFVATVTTTRLGLVILSSFLAGCTILLNALQRRQGSTEFRFHTTWTETGKQRFRESGLNIARLMGCLFCVQLRACN